jgi:hypothetical protein
MDRKLMSSIARTVTRRGSFGNRGLRASGVLLRSTAMLRSFSFTSTLPLTSHTVRLSVSPWLNSTRPADKVRTLTFLASAARFSRFIASSGAKFLSN